MSTSEARTITGPDRLSWKQICKLYPDEWVVVTDIKWLDEGDYEFDSALVLGHFRSRKEASPHIKAAFQHYDEIGSYWTGAIRGPIPRFMIP
jgi:hypothetical protein